MSSDAEDVELLGPQEPDEAVPRHVDKSSCGSRLLSPAPLLLLVALSLLACVVVAGMLADWPGPEGAAEALLLVPDATDEPEATS